MNYAKKAEHFSYFFCIFLGSELACSYLSVPCTHHYQIAAIQYFISFCLYFYLTLLLLSALDLFSWQKQRNFYIRYKFQISRIMMFRTRLFPPLTSMPANMENLSLLDLEKNYQERGKEATLIDNKLTAWCRGWYKILRLKISF